MAHVVWDWNGTLVADLDITIEAINVVMRAFDGRAVTAHDYGQHFRRPVRDFYEHLLDRRLDNDTWERIDVLFHEHYHQRVDTVSLAASAHDALAGVAAAGHTQSLLSMWRHDRLLREVDRHGIGTWFARVDGNHAEQGAPKSRFLARHLEKLRIDSSTVVMVGDSLDDAEAAHAVGARAVLVTSTHHVERLREAGVPMVDRLVDAVDHL